MRNSLIERFELVYETKRHKYYVSNQGYVLSVSSKSYKERKYLYFCNECIKKYSQLKEAEE